MKQASKTDDKKFQWDWPHGGEIFMMLNTDIELAFDIDVDNQGAGTTCEIPARSSGMKFGECPEAKTLDLVKVYANVRYQLEMLGKVISFTFKNNL